MHGRHARAGKPRGNEALGTMENVELLIARHRGEMHVIEWPLDPAEDGLNVLTSEAVESLPRTTPLEELGRSFQSLLSNAKEEERPLVHEAWKATVARLQEEGVI